jgi:signal transduction histidine kinase
MQARCASHFELSVSATGPIPSQERERIFEKSRQIDSSHTRAKGTGLGLAMAREIVEMHGCVWVDSTIGVGSTFRMELPVRAAVGDAAT